ncbi:MAG: ABC transporter permease [Clostridia bacterium]|nr:ABC transporter permease [Clostridia bacterium]
MKASNPHKKPFPHFRHACTMVGRNGRAYIKLSVTVVLSFTLLLGYMALTDARLYNQYAKVFTLPKEVVQCYVESDPETMRAFLNLVEANVPNVQYYDYFSSSTELTTYEQSLHAECFFLPQGVETLYTIDSSTTLDANAAGGTTCGEPIALLGDKQDFNLQKGEAIINEGFYNSLIAGGAEEPLTVLVPFYWADGSHSVWELDVVGVCEDVHGVFIRENLEDGRTSGYVTVYLSQSQLDEGAGEFEYTKQIAFTSSDSPEAVMSYGRALGMVAQGVAEVQNEARTAMQNAISSKAITAAVMLALLAINLYSSFSNVLETRNYEIGIKRAIGAPQSAITRQFLYEALLVLGFDTLLSMSLVADGLIVYKAVQKYYHEISWVAYVSPYSLIIYIACSLALAIAFSLLFAYKATRVEVVKHLKAE